MFKKILPLAVAAALTSGCTVVPLASTSGERQARVTQDQAAMFRDQEPVSGELSFADVLARAYKYNLETRVKLMENALARSQLDLGFYDMLPRLTAAAGYTTRSNDPGGTAMNLRTGQVQTDVSVAQERTRHTEQLTLSWNALDFGLSYVRAQQSANQVLIAEERRRKTMQNITQEVYTAYWRALAAQRFSADIDRLHGVAEAALADSQRIEEKRLMPPMQALVYQRGLLEIVQQLRLRRNELEGARMELAALMNLRPGAAFRLKDDGAEPALPPAMDAAAITRMEDHALMHRAELREEDYRKRNSALEMRKAVLSVLPGLSFDTGLQHDSNKYLYNNSWYESGLRVSFNLFKAFSLPAARRQHEAQMKVDDMRRAALGMAVMTQVRISAERYRQTVEEYTLAQRLDGIDQRINAQMANAVKSSSESELEAIRAQVRSVLSSLQRAYSQASMQAAHARMLNSIGVDLAVPQQAGSLAEFSTSLDQGLKNWTVDGIVGGGAK
ncbi:TolC family protein [Massilia sp. PAMC28688]|uniref:TolC family protein n=1 Tax=Massilia sp. PAMC28688 TaxID=2861283 RepID=UPI001C6347C0|nr:TolC family protein [Massilia sp. PAMC28688]QYF92712.1 TolC family protein [Massilia sp. PAMC28688]